MKNIDKSHGSPWDRGSADSYYRRKMDPHWYPNGTGNLPRIEKDDMTDEQIREYYLGFEDNENLGDFKDYGEVW